MNRKIINLLLLATIIATGLIPAGIWAVETGSPDDLSLRGPDGIAGNYRHIYYGEHNGNPIRWRILDRSGGELLLLSEGAVASMQFDGTDPKTNDYESSDIRSWLVNTYFNSFTVKEIAAMRSNSDVYGDKIFLLSTAEASNPAYFPGGNSDRATGHTWWLRSSILHVMYILAGVVMSDGFVNSSTGWEVDNIPLAVRPACKLNLASVLFTSATAGGAPATVGSDLAAVTPPAGDMKLTLADSGQTLSIGDVIAESCGNGSAVTVSYSGAATGPGNYLCVELTGGGDTYRGAIKALTAGSESGTATFNLPVTLDPDNYSFRLWNEQYSAAYHTNYAGTPISKNIEFISPYIISDSSSLPTGIIGTSYSAAALTAWGGTAPYIWTAAGMPAGLHIDPFSGEISGTPDDAGTFNVTVTVTGGNGKTGQKEFPLTIYQTFSIELADLTINPGTLNPAFNKNIVIYQADADPGIDNIEITAQLADLAATLTIAGSTAETGVAETVYLDQGANLIPIVVTAPGGNSQKCYVISVNGTVDNADLAVLSINGYSLNPAFSAGQTEYNLNVGSSVSSLDLSAESSDPKALVLVGGAILNSGETRTVNLNPGENTIEVMVVAQNASTRTYTLTATRAAALTVDTASLPIALKDRPYSATLEASGGSGPYRWSAAGLPAGLTLDENSGAISGAVVTVGEYDVQVTVEDADGFTVSKTLTLKVRPGTGNGAYIVTPDDDPAYTGGLSADGIVTMTVNSGMSGFKYFNVSVTPVSGHTGDEVLVFVHLRSGKQIGINATGADFDSISRARAAFNVRPGDVIKAYLVDGLTNDPGVNPVVL